MCHTILETRMYGTLLVPNSSSCGGLVAFGHLEGPSGPLDPTPLDLQPSSKLQTLSLQTQCLDTMSGHNVWTQCLDTMSGHNVWTQCLDKMSVHNGWTQCGYVAMYSTVQYSTITGEENGVRRWQTPYSTLCGASVTGATSLVAECGTNSLFKKC